MRTPFLPSVSAALAACALLSAAPSALAHGGIPRAYEILPEPGNPEHTVLRSYIWGLMHTRNGGATWEYTCSEVYGANSTTAGHVNVAVMPGGRVLVASSFRGLFYTDDGCNWQKRPEFDGLIVQDVRRDSRPGGALYVATSIGKDGSIEGVLWISNDGGDTWEELGPLPVGFAPTQIAFPQGESSTIYLSGGWVGGGHVFLRSPDGGATWVRSDLPLALEDGDARAVLVHPTDPGVVFVWADRPEIQTKDEPDKYLVTTDGGATWKVLFQGTADLPGLVLSPDASKIYVGGSLDGIQEATLAQALEQGPAAFQRVYEYGVWSLRFDGEDLLVGGNNYGGVGEPEYTLGVSTDLGRTATPTMSVCDLQFEACGPETTVGATCLLKWSEPNGRGLHSDYIAPRCQPRFNPPDGGPGTTDPEPRAKTKSEGGCAMGAGGPGSAGVAAGLLALAAAVRRRRRA